jgi:hypothetical protein
MSAYASHASNADSYCYSECISRLAYCSEVCHSATTNADSSIVFHTEFDAQDRVHIAVLSVVYLKEWMSRFGQRYLRVDARLCVLILFRFLWRTTPVLLTLYLVSHVSLLAAHRYSSVRSPIV